MQSIHIDFLQKDVILYFYRHPEGKPYFSSKRFKPKVVASSHPCRVNPLSSGERARVRGEIRIRKNAFVLIAEGARRLRNIWEKTKEKFG